MAVLANISSVESYPWFFHLIDFPTYVSSIKRHESLFSLNGSDWKTREKGFYFLKFQNRKCLRFFLYCTHNQVTKCLIIRWSCGSNEFKFQQSSDYIRLKKVIGNLYKWYPPSIIQITQGLELPCIPKEWLSSSSNRWILDIS